MCEFCDALKNKKEIEVSTRSTYADDNVCEVLASNNCSTCGGCCKDTFMISAFEYNDSFNLELSYEHTMLKGELVIHPFSEAIPFNYCPICGTQLSNNVTKFEDISRDKIEIIED